MRRAIKKRDHENLSDSAIERVIKCLSQDKPITKKEACNILNISYNTTRLNRIIEDYRERQEFIKTRKAANRGKPASDLEIAEAAALYLQGVSISEIASGLFRSPSFVKSLIERIGVPQKPRKEDRVAIEYLPDNCCAESFEENEIVWSARHHAIARVQKELTNAFVSSQKGMNNTDYESKYAAKVYQIYVLENVDSEGTYFPGVTTGGYHAYAPAYDLGKLVHLKKYGVDLSRLSSQ